LTVYWETATPELSIWQRLPGRRSNWPQSIC